MAAAMIRCRLVRVSHAAATARSSWSMVHLTSSARAGYSMPTGTSTTVLVHRTVQVLYSYRTSTVRIAIQAHRHNHLNGQNGTSTLQVYVVYSITCKYLLVRRTSSSSLRQTVFVSEVWNTRSDCCTRTRTCSYSITVGGPATCTRTYEYRYCKTT